MNPENKAGRNTYAGLFIIALATLMYEILLTRIFSVTMWYHFAVVAVSVAMFGMTVGAICVYLFADYFTPARAKRHLILFSLLFAASVVFSFLLHLQIHFGEPTSYKGLASLAITYLLIAVPFTFSGICVSVALSKFPGQVSLLYAADLVGAAIGCILVIVTLDVTDGPTAVIVVAFLASVGAILFAAERGFGKWMGVAVALGTILAMVSIASGIQAARQRPLIRLNWVKGAQEASPFFEKWNSFSRVTVVGDPSVAGAPFGWGISSTFPDKGITRQLYVAIDSAAGTVMTFFDGNLQLLEHLKYDVSNVAHYIRPNASVLVVGAGGGRDVLSSLAFGDRSVLAVEINKNIINALNRNFGDFTGHLDRYPNVSFVNDEARSFIARQTVHFDLIQISLIDTWAATAAGAFVLAENSLYTVEAWKTMLNHLTPGGVLTVSRYYHGESPPEIYRLTALATTVLLQLGVDDPRKHIMIVRHRGPAESPDVPGVGTMLVSKEPFSDQDVDSLQEVCRRMKFDLVLSPRAVVNATFEGLSSSKDIVKTTTAFDSNIAAPTDDEPFFLHMLRLRSLKNMDLWRPGRHLQYEIGAVVVLGGLLVIVSVFTIICILVPLLLKAGRASLGHAVPLGVFFCSIGLGFMMIEISQMQRLVVFLGHPTYGLSVVLFTLLLSGGLGSYWTQRIDPARDRSGIWRLVLLLGALAVFGRFTPYAITLFQGSVTPVRICVALGLLGPIGLFMGMPFPLGMKLASSRSSSLTPWLWGINGATSVCASVLAVTISLQAGITATFWTGFLCYVAAFLAFLWSRGRAKGGALNPIAEAANVQV